MGGLLLDAQVAVLWRPWCCDQLGHDGRRDIERDVGEYLVGRRGQRRPQKVLVADSDVRKAGEPAAQLPGEVWVYLDRYDPTTTPRQPFRDKAVARPDLVHDVVGHDAGPVKKMVDQPRLGEEVLGIDGAAALDGCHVTVPFKDQDAQKSRTARWLVRLEAEP